MNEIPQDIINKLNVATEAYSQSPATTNAGRILRFIASIVSPSIIIKILSHQLTTK